MVSVNNMSFEVNNLKEQTHFGEINVNINNSGIGIVAISVSEKSNLPYQLLWHLMAS